MNYSKVVAFDIDGILTPDSKIPFTRDEAYEAMVHKNCNLHTCFEPDEPWVALTSRPYQDKELTTCWLNSFSNPPVAIFHDNTDPFNPVEYKYTVLKEHKFPVFFESDFDTVRELHKRLTGIKIVHWNTFINLKINSLLKGDSHAVSSFRLF